MKFANIPVEGQPTIARQLGRKIVIAAAVFALAMPLASSCRNGDMTKLLKARANYERKLDSVKQEYGEKIEALLKSAKTQEERFQAQSEIDTLKMQYRMAAKPFEDGLIETNKKLSDYDIFGKHLGSPPQ